MKLVILFVQAIPQSDPSVVLLFPSVCGYHVFFGIHMYPVDRPCRYLRKRQKHGVHPKEISLILKLLQKKVSMSRLLFSV